MPIVNYLWNPLNDNIIREFDDSGTVIAEYTTESNMFGNVVSQRRNGQDSVYHYDGQGSTLALTDANGNITDTYAYSAFGEVTAQTGSTVNPFQFLGRKGYYHDFEAGDVDVRWRSLSTRQGRWISVDPLISDTLNGFLYVHNSPVNMVDPSGLDPLDMPCSCDDALDDFLNVKTSPPAGATCRRLFARCKIHVYCADTCGTVDGFTFSKDGFVHICLSRADVTRRLFFGLIIHECEHANQIVNAPGNEALCHQGRRSKPWPNDELVELPPIGGGGESCEDCEAKEKRPYENQAKYLFPNDIPKQNEFIAAGLCGSCRHACEKYRKEPCPTPPMPFILLPAIPTLPGNGDAHLPRPLAPDEDLPLPPQIPFPALNAKF
jgi:RHS repeat-associated protein